MNWCAGSDHIPVYLCSTWRSVKPFVTDAAFNRSAQHTPEIFIQQAWVSPVKKCIHLYSLFVAVEHNSIPDKSQHETNNAIMHGHSPCGNCKHCVERLNYGNALGEKETIFWKWNKKILNRSQQAEERIHNLENNLSITEQHLVQEIEKKNKVAEEIQMMRDRLIILIEEILPWRWTTARFFSQFCVSLSLTTLVLK